MTRGGFTTCSFSEVLQSPPRESGATMSPSENHLQPYLNQSTAWGRDEPSDMAGASRKDVKPRSIEVGLVQEIKNLSPELHTEPVAWFEDLLTRKIDIVKPWPRNRVSSQVAISPGRRPRKGARIEPQIGSSQLLSCSYTGATFCNSRRGIVAIAGIEVWPVGRPPVPVLGTVISDATG